MSNGLGNTCVSHECLVVLESALLEITTHVDAYYEPYLQTRMWQ